MSMNKKLGKGRDGKLIIKPYVLIGGCLVRIKGCGLLQDTYMENDTLDDIDGDDTRRRDAASTRRPV